MPYIDPKLKGDEAVTSLKTEGEESTPSTRATQQQEQPEHERPEFTIQNVLGDIRYGFNQLVFNPDFNIIIVPILVTVESIVVKMIRGLVSYTEIDYTAYMEQINIIKSGELNYANIFGGTGPLVYPAGHVWIYRALSWLTYGTKNIYLGQAFFGWLYVFTLVIVFTIYLSLRVPPWVIYLIVLSKRLHSIYVLRLFNDCFTTLFMVLTVLALQYSSYYKIKDQKTSKFLSNHVSAVLYGIAISIKMNALLYLPGFLMLVYFLNDERLIRALVPVVVVTLTQIIISWTFLFNGTEIRNSYIANAFNFKRKFLYEWTVNWRFLSADIFNSTQFHHLLLVTHTALLLLFIFAKWASPKVSGKSVSSLLKDFFNVFHATMSPTHVINNPVKGPMYVVGVMASCNMIGVICSRSLHYQFLSWYSWSFPYLLYLSGLHWIPSIVVFISHEWCWNVFPSTTASSGLLLVINIAVLAGYYFNSSVQCEVLVEDKKEK